MGSGIAAPQRWQVEQSVSRRREASDTFGAPASARISLVGRMSNSNCAGL
jgi:hypothetical protein